MIVWQMRPRICIVDTDVFVDTLLSVEMYVVLIL